MFSSGSFYWVDFISVVFDQNFRIVQKVYYIMIQSEKKRRNLGRVTSRSTLWDRYWGQNGGQLNDASPVTVAQATARCDSPQRT